MNENMSKIIRDDLILFKNETLRDIKETEKILIEKYRDIEFTILEKIDSFDKQFIKFRQKMIEITAFIDSLKDVKNNLNILIAHKTKSENSIIDLDIKLKSFIKDSNKSFFNINNILKDSVIYPGIIGGSSKFKKFHDLIDFTLSNFAQYKIFKEKISKDVNNNRINLDNNIEKLSTQIRVILDKNDSLVTNEIALSEKKILSILKTYEEKLLNIKNENEIHNSNLKNEINQLINYCKEQFSGIKDKKKDLFLKYNDLKEKFIQNNNEINDLKEKNLNLYNIIMKINAHLEDISNNELEIKNSQNIKRDSKVKRSFKLLSANNIDLKRNRYKNKKTEKRISDFIKGNRNLEYLKTFQNKSNFKSNEIKNNEYLNKENYKIINFFGNSQSYKRFSSKKENDKNKLLTPNKIFENNKINNDIEANNISEPEDYYNSYTIKSKKSFNDSFRIKAVNNLKEKSTYVNLNANDNYSKSKQLKKNSLNLEENEPIIIIEPKKEDNSKIDNNLQNTININNIIETKKNNNFISGFPRIITNNGERIIISPHPVYHRYKFTNNINPNIFSTYMNNFFIKNKGKKNKFNYKGNINSFSENQYSEENYNNNSDKNKIIYTVNNNIDDSYNDNNFFKTSPNPKSIEKHNKNEYTYNKRKNNSYKNKKIKKFNRNSKK